jgi:hypothetical protein
LERAGHREGVSQHIDRASEYLSSRLAYNCRDPEVLACANDLEGFRGSMQVEKER